MSAHALFTALAIFLHDLFTVLWIGGILTMALVLVPALRAARKTVGGPEAGPGSGPAANTAMPREGPLATFSKIMQSRLAVVSLVSLAGLLVTGVLRARSSGAGGLFRFDTVYDAVLSAKHILVAGLAVSSLLRRRSLTAGGRAAGGLLVANVSLAVAILALSALNAALSATAAL